MPKDKEIHIYTDGSCLGNPGPGGWGTVILIGDHQQELSGGAPETTNNRMEMMAVIEALKWLHDEGNTQADVTIHSDSSLIINTMTQGWKKKANTDLWAEIEKHSAWLNITWIWVKGHADNKYNNHADQLAVSAAEEIKRSL